MALGVAHVVAGFHRVAVFDLQPALRARAGVLVLADVVGPDDEVLPGGVEERELVVVLRAVTSVFVPRQGFLPTVGGQEQRRLGAVGQERRGRRGWTRP